jgi:hypothetical protein
MLLERAFSLAGEDAGSAVQVRPHNDKCRYRETSEACRHNESTGWMQQPQRSRNQRGWQVDDARHKIVHTDRGRAPLQFYICDERLALRFVD